MVYFAYHFYDFHWMIITYVLDLINIHWLSVRKCCHAGYGSTSASSYLKNELFSTKNSIM